METNELKQKDNECIMHTYSRFNLVIESGKDAYVFDKSGQRYIDFIGGIACAPAGHSNRSVAKAVCHQSKKLVHASNLYFTEPMVALAVKLSGISGMKKCFFCNSGAEANEAAIKLAKKITKKTDFIVCKGAFHGRTHAALSATWKESYKAPFRPLVEGFTFVDYNSPGAIESAISPKTAAVMIEPIQGEAGVIVPEIDYLEKVHSICKSHGILLILDEVQTGCGRTGKFFAFHHSRIKPDIVTLAKGLANGIPIGVCISDYEFEPGNHASTFGGNCIACAAANATIDFIMDKNLMKNAQITGAYLREKLSRIPKVAQVRGKGLMIGADIECSARDITMQCMEKGLLINNAAENTLRFLPPLTIHKKHVDEALGILSGVLSK